jgi:hypothetical protein
VKCREHDWKPELLHSLPREDGSQVPSSIDYLCRKCGEWRSGPYDRAAWLAHGDDVLERIRWDALLNAPAANV